MKPDILAILGVVILLTSHVSCDNTQFICDLLNFEQTSEDIKEVSYRLFQALNSSTIDEEKLFTEINTYNKKYNSQDFLKDNSDIFQDMIDYINVHTGNVEKNLETKETKRIRLTRRKIFKFHNDVVIKVIVLTNDVTDINKEDTIGLIDPLLSEANVFGYIHYKRNDLNYKPKYINCYVYKNLNFIVMKKYESLKDYINNRFDLKQIFDQEHGKTSVEIAIKNWTILTDIIDASAELNNIGILHGDIKLDNIVMDVKYKKENLVISAGKPSIIDFGTSHFIGPSVRSRELYTSFNRVSVGIDYYTSESLNTNSGTLSHTSSYRWLKTHYSENDEGYALLMTLASVAFGTDFYDYYDAYMETFVNIQHEVSVDLGIEQAFRKCDSSMKCITEVISYTKDKKLKDNLYDLYKKFRNQIKAFISRPNNTFIKAFKINLNKLFTSKLTARLNELNIYEKRLNSYKALYEYEKSKVPSNGKSITYYEETISEWKATMIKDDKRIKNDKITKQEIMNMFITIKDYIIGNMFPDDQNTDRGASNTEPRADSIIPVIPTPTEIKETLGEPLKEYINSLKINHKCKDEPFYNNHENIDKKIVKYKDSQIVGFAIAISNIYYTEEVNTEDDNEEINPEELIQETTNDVIRFFNVPQEMIKLKVKINPLNPFDALRAKHFGRNGGELVDIRTLKEAHLKKHNNQWGGFRSNPNELIAPKTFIDKISNINIKNLNGLPKKEVVFLPVVTSAQMQEALVNQEKKSYIKSLTSRKTSSPVVVTDARLNNSPNGLFMTSIQDDQLTSQKKIKKKIAIFGSRSNSNATLVIPDTPRSVKSFQIKSVRNASSKILDRGTSRDTAAETPIMKAVFDRKFSVKQILL